MSGALRRHAAGLAAAAAGVLFAFGLGLGGMTRPSKVIAFLDVAGAWDPSLAFVMAGAIGVHLVVLRRIRPGQTPLFAARFAVPARGGVDARLVAGAAIFGVGWGLAGYCPGPAVVSVTTHTTDAVAFFAAMMAGIAAYTLVLERRFARPSDDTDAARDRENLLA
jgi:uncharacterized membrane protein YedE/YeeE